MTRLVKLSIGMVGIIAVTALGFLLHYLYLEGHVQLNNPGKKRFPVRGIDISHHQGQIDWQTVREYGFKFVFIKATEGGDFKDRRFKVNWQAAAEIGLVRGAYHFFTFCKPGKEQALNFIDTVPVEADTLPPVIDIEYSGNCRARPSREELQAELIAYVNEIERVYRVTPILYVTEDIYAEYLPGMNYPLWIRDVYFEPRLSQDRSWLFWQYTHRGRVNGIKGFVDMNVFNGSEAEFKKILLVPSS